MIVNWSLCTGIVSPPPPSIADGNATSTGCAKSDASDEVLQTNIDYMCSTGVDCKLIQDDGPALIPTL